MNFRDQWATNKEGERFLFTVEMQRQLIQAGLPANAQAWDDFSLQGATENHREVEKPRKEFAAALPPRPREPFVEPPPTSKAYTEPKTIQIDPMTGKYVGRVKWYNTKKGYGFIVRGAGEEIFFHKSATVGEVEEFDEGQWILYDVETTAKGPEATDVEPYLGEPLE